MGGKTTEVLTEGFISKFNHECGGILDDSVDLKDLRPLSGNIGNWLNRSTEGEAVPDIWKEFVDSLDPVTKRAFQRAINSARYTLPLSVKHLGVLRTYDEVGLIKVGLGDDQRAKKKTIRRLAHFIVEGFKKTTLC